MRILLFHPELLPPKDYGGVERVVLWLAQGLQQRGHSVTVAALPGSSLPLGCQLLEVEKKHYSASELMEIFPENLDVAHFMAPLAEKVWGELQIPSLLTVHGNGQVGESYPKNTVFLSQDHAQRHGGNFYIYNGIDPSEYLFEPEKKEDWYLFLSKTSWRVKNLSGAMRFCKKARAALKIAGGTRPLWKRLECIWTPSFEWLGPVSGIRKAQYLARAKALLFPITWPEPFGLVVAEALVSGTPVIASPRGSLREMLPPEVGALPQSDQEWLELLGSGKKRWDPAVCRDWALKKFHYSVMAENYEQAYRQISGGKTLHQVNPITKQDFRKQSAIGIS